MYHAASPWAVAGDVAHTRSITSNLITGARDHTHHPRHTTQPAGRTRPTMPDNR
ncbi:SPW repeat protein [Streptomyces sp. NPDC127069]|uniref:SPW repeat domain-containing protein n=1 Tax=Streptomyces sp. NPDC127069 TaxID=3347128 RepID=UPI003669EAF2